MRSPDTLDAKITHENSTQELQVVNEIMVGVVPMVVFLFIEHIRSNGYFVYLYLIMKKKVVSFLLYKEAK